MQLLLDTHTFIWFVNDDLNLSANAKELIENPLNQRWLSVASPWEMAIKTQRRKADANLILGTIHQQKPASTSNTIATHQDRTLIYCFHPTTSSS